MKVRNLQQSHDYREYKKKDPTGAFYIRRRIFRPSAAPPKECHETTPRQPPLKTATQTSSTLDEEIECTRFEREATRTWVVERKAQRKDLDALGLTSSWLEKKTDKTECEKRVISKMQVDAEKLNEAAEKEREAFLRAKRRKRRLSSVHVDLLPFVKKPLPIALAMIADYLAEKRLRLIDLFTKVDKNKDWQMTREELKMAFKRIKIPLTDAQLDHLILALDVNNDNELSYKEVAQGIEAYHKDRRWQRMKVMYDNALNEGTTGTEDVPNQTNLKDNLDLLNLPDIEVQLNNRRRRSSFKPTPRLSKEKKEADDSFITTMLGVNMKRRIEFLKFLNKECKHCLETLQANGIFIRKEGLERVYMPPTEVSEDLCLARLSSGRSIFPFSHPMNVSCRRSQKRTLRRLARHKSSYTNLQIAPDQQRKNESARYLPRVASFEDISREGRNKRWQIENASPSPYWPQHLLDKLCLCMDDCHIGSDRKDVMFNFVK